MKTQIILVIDYPIFRQGLRLILENSDKFDVIGEVSNETDLLKILQKTEPELIIINLMSLNNETTRLGKFLNTNYSNVPYIIFADRLNEVQIFDCINSGAKGIIWHENTSEQFLNIVHKVINGERIVNIPDYFQINRRSVTKKEFTTYYLQSNKNGISVLSDREIEVVKLFAEGKSYKSIADKLNISPRTVESHKKNILAKLKLNSIIDLVKFALKNKLVAS